MVISSLQSGNGAALQSMLFSERRSDAFGSARGDLGVNWSLVLQITGWVIQGVGLGMSAYDAIKNAEKETGAKPGDLDKTDISSLASQIAAQDPQGRTSAQWESLLGQALSQQTTTPVQCPPGYEIDPTGKFCLEKKAGILEDMPTWGWIGIGIGGLLVLRQMKII